MKKNEMVDLLMSCYFDGMSVGEAMIYIKRCYMQTPTAKQLQAAISTIERCTNNTWR